MLRTDVELASLSKTGRIAFAGIGLLGCVLITASALNLDLGVSAFACGLFVALVISFRERNSAREIAAKVSWSVIPLVASLFILVEALNSAGAMSAALGALKMAQNLGGIRSTLSTAFGVAVASNLMNNLPSGLIAGAAVEAAHVNHAMRNSVLVGVDLGPNLSVSGSLATILWLIAIRRDGQDVKFFTFLKWGAIVMPPALLAAVLCLQFIPT
jgi:arsenical pump membrane protein